MIEIAFARSNARYTNPAILCDWKLQKMHPGHALPLRLRRLRLLHGLLHSPAQGRNTSGAMSRPDHMIHQPQAKRCHSSPASPRTSSEQPMQVFEHSTATIYLDFITSSEPPSPSADFFTAFFAAFLAAIARTRNKTTSRKLEHRTSRLRSASMPQGAHPGLFPPLSERHASLDRRSAELHASWHLHAPAAQPPVEAESGHACVCASEAPPPEGTPPSHRSSPAPLCSTLSPQFRAHASKR